MVNPAIRNVIELEAARFKLDADLVEAIVMTESSGRPIVRRFERAFMEKYLMKLSVSEHDRISLATSWGLMQVMGQVARELGLVGDPVKLCEPTVGVFYGCKLLAQKVSKYQDQDAAVASYNAGTPRRDSQGRFINQEYVNRVNKFLGVIRNERAASHAG